MDLHGPVGDLMLCRILLSTFLLGASCVTSRLDARVAADPPSLLDFIYPRAGEAPMPEPGLALALPRRLLLMDCSGVNAAWREIPGSTEALEKILRSWPGVESITVVKSPGSFNPIFSQAFHVEWMDRTFAKHPADAVAMVFSTYVNPRQTANLPATLMAGSPARFGTPGMAILSIFTALTNQSSVEAIDAELVVMAWPTRKLLLRVRAQDAKAPGGKPERPTLQVRTRVYDELARKVGEVRGSGGGGPAPPEPQAWKPPVGPLRLGVMLASLGAREEGAAEAIPAGKALPAPLERDLMDLLVEEGRALAWVKAFELLPWRDLARETGAEGLLQEARVRSMDRVAILLVDQRISPNEFGFRWWYPYLQSLDRHAGSHWPSVMYAQVHLHALLLDVGTQEPGRWVAGFGVEKGPEHVSRWGYPSGLITPLMPTALRKACRDLVATLAGPPAPQGN